MPVRRLSTRYADVVDEHGDDLAALVRGVAALARSPQSTPEDTARLAALGGRLLSSFEVLRLQASAIDDAMRAIAAIARAGRDTPKIRRIRREIVEDQSRLARSEGARGDS
jgi:hypothetical protein